MQIRICNGTQRAYRRVEIRAENDFQPQPLCAALTTLISGLVREASGAVEHEVWQGAVINYRVAPNFYRVAMPTLRNTKRKRDKPISNIFGQGTRIDELGPIHSGSPGGYKVMPEQEQIDVPDYCQRDARYHSIAMEPKVEHVFGMR
jgi:hypothetical protein